MSRSEPQLPGTVSCVVDNVAQSGHDAGLATVQKIKSHQVETGIVVRISARNARGQCVSGREQSEARAPDGVDFFVVESRCEAVRHVDKNGDGDLSFFLHCQTMCSCCRLLWRSFLQCLVVRAAG